MPSSSKKKKDKNVDFTKAKLKLGKGKKPANNAVDTSFKARSIAVPSQSIGQDKGSSTPTTRRNLTLDDLLLHLKHYNANTRKDAIAGLRELLEAHPDLIESCLTAILHACARIFSDEDSDVRKSLNSFFTWLLRTSPPQFIRPHIPFLMLFITSAQTNIFPAIRIDAIRFIDALLDHVPDLIVQNWLQPDSTGSRVLDGYLGLLNSSSKFWSGSKDDNPGPSTASVTLSPSSRLVVLSSLATFLEKVLLPSEVKQTSLVPKWVFAPYFPSKHEWEAFCAFVYPRRADEQFSDIAWGTTEAVFVGPFEGYCHVTGGTHDIWLSPDEVGDLMRDSGGPSKQNSSKSPPSFQRSAYSDQLMQLARILQPILTTTWLDVAPSVFVPVPNKSGNEVETQLAVAILRIAGCLYGSIFRNADILDSSKELVGDELCMLLNHVSIYLPHMIEMNDFQSQEFIQSMNFTYCELVSLTLMAGTGTGLDGAAATIDTYRKRDKSLSVQLKRVGDYVIKILNGELGSVLSTSAYISLLPTLWYLLIHKSNNASLFTIASALIDHSTHLASRSGSKAASTQLIGIFTLLCDVKNGTSRSLSVTSNELVRLREWYQQLPKTLWEIGSNDDNLTEIILLLLLRISLRRVRVFDENAHHAVISRLVPFFTTTHPQKGEIVGPFTKLKPPLRKLALDVVNVLVHDHGTAGTRLRTSVDRAVMATADTPYWLSNTT